MIVRILVGRPHGLLYSYSDDSLDDGYFSHVLQLSLNFVENIILHLFVLEVAGVWAILYALSAIFLVLLDTLCKALVKSLSYVMSVVLTILHVSLMLFDVSMQTCISISSVVGDKALLQFGRAETKSNF